MYRNTWVCVWVTGNCWFKQPHLTLSQTDWTLGWGGWGCTPVKSAQVKPPITAHTQIEISCMAAWSIRYTYLAPVPSMYNVKNEPAFNTNTVPHTKVTQVACVKWHCYIHSLIAYEIWSLVCCYCFRMIDISRGLRFTLIPGFISARVFLWV